MHFWCSARRVFFCTCWTNSPGNLNVFSVFMACSTAPTSRFGLVQPVVYSSIVATAPGSFISMRECIRCPAKTYNTALIINQTMHWSAGPKLDFCCSTATDQWTALHFVLFFYFHSHWRNSYIVLYYASYTVENSSILLNLFISLSLPTKQNYYTLKLFILFITNMRFIESTFITLSTITRKNYHTSCN